MITFFIKFALTMVVNDNATIRVPLICSDVLQCQTEDVLITIKCTHSQKTI